MFDLELFLGFAPDAEFEQMISRLNPSLVALLISGGDYLSEISHRNRRYLGKPVTPFPSVTQLENLETHLLSLLKKLVPEYPFSKNPPVLIISFDGHSNIQG